MGNYPYLCQYFNMFFEMTLQEAIEARHSVRAYKELPLAEDVVKVLKRAQTEKGFLFDTIWAQRIWV